MNVGTAVSSTLGRWCPETPRRMRLEPACSACSVSPKQTSNVVFSCIPLRDGFRLYRYSKKGTEHAFTSFRRRCLRKEVCSLTRGETPSLRSGTDRRYKDRPTAFPQKWRCGGHQGWSADRQRVDARLGLRRTGRPSRSTPYGG